MLSNSKSLRDAYLIVWIVLSTLGACNMGGSLIVFNSCTGAVLKNLSAAYPRVDYGIIMNCAVDSARYQALAVLLIGTALLSCGAFCYVKSELIRIHKIRQR